MMKALFVLAACIAFPSSFVTAADSYGAEPATSPQCPPHARQEPHAFREFGKERPDEFAWMTTAKGSELLAYLSAENACAHAALEPLASQVAGLEREIRGRAESACESLQFREGGYAYQCKMAAGARFGQIVRQKLKPDSAEEVVLDIEKLAEGYTQFALDGFVVSPDASRFAFAVDTTGARTHRLFVRDLWDGKIMDLGIADAASDLAFSADSRILLAVRTDARTVRSNRVVAIDLGAPADIPKTVYLESDETFEVTLSRAISGRFIFINSKAERETEVRALPADAPSDPPRLIAPRSPGLIYEVDHIGDGYYIRTNLGAPDFKLVWAPEASPQPDNWRDVVPYSPGNLISEFELSDSAIAVAIEHENIKSVRVFRRFDLTEISVPRPTEVGVMQLQFPQGLRDRDLSFTVFHLRFSGPAYPESVFEFDTRTGAMRLAKRSRAWESFSPDQYQIRRIEAKAQDGESVPVTLLYRTDLLREGGNPVLVLGYGAYGSSLLPEFPDNWISLVNRGFIYALAHVRGGREKGQAWHDRGSMLEKQNSFTDFVAATEAILQTGLANRSHVFAHGMSAGGLLVGAVANMRPDLYAGIVAEVPFVDVITTMRDPAIPLTTLEYEEWGNPEIQQQYDYMRSYSPYDNVRRQAYPAIFVTGAINDTQVDVHEPAKWVARLRARKTDSRPLLFLVDMTAGHEGVAGRFGRARGDAEIMAWLLSLAGIPAP